MPAQEIYANIAIYIFAISASILNQNPIYNGTPLFFF